MNRSAKVSIDCFLFLLFWFRISLVSDRDNIVCGSWLYPANWGKALVVWCRYQCGQIGEIRGNTVTLSLALLSVSAVVAGVIKRCPLTRNGVLERVRRSGRKDFFWLHWSLRPRRVVRSPSNASYTFGTVTNVPNIFPFLSFLCTIQNYIYKDYFHGSIHVALPQMWKSELF